MSIEYDGKTEDGTITCDAIPKDGCHGQIMLSGSFASVIEQAKAMGWKLAKEGDRWQHFCPACA